MVQFLSGLRRGFLQKINFLLKVLRQFLSQIWIKPWLEKMITGYFVRWELWNVTLTRPRPLERTGLDCSFPSKENTISQKDWLHGGLHLRSRRHIGNWLREICHSLKSKPTNWELCLPHGHTSIAYQLKKSSRLQFGPVRPSLPDSTWETCIGSSL